MSDETHIENLMEGLRRELKRAKDVLDLYESIPSGMFGATMIKREIAMAEDAIASGDIESMLKAYTHLKAIE